MTHRMRAACALAVLLASACAGEPQQPSAQAREDRAPVDLTLVAADGRRFGLAELRGRPLLLFVFTTYDEASQLALTPLSAFLTAHPGLSALGIAAQPNPDELLPLYRDALGVRFPLAYEVEQQIVAGESMLGAIETVPTYVLLDAQGRVVARHTGALTEQELQDFAGPVLP